MTGMQIGHVCRTLEVAQTLEGHVNIPRDCDVSADANFFVTCSNGSDSEGCEVNLWDRRQGKLLQQFSGHAECVNACICLASFHSETYPMVRMESSSLLTELSRVKCSIAVLVE